MKHSASRPRTPSTETTRGVKEARRTCTSAASQYFLFLMIIIVIIIIYEATFRNCPIYYGIVSAKRDLTYVF